MNFVIFVCGLVVGWLIARRKGPPAEVTSEMARLTERLASRDRELESAVARESDSRSQLQAAVRQLQEEAGRRASAEEKAGRVPELQDAIRERETALQGLRMEIQQLRAQQAELQTTVEKEREAAQERLALLEKAKEQLSEAFRALSADALKSNNAAFLDTAKAVLEKHQEQARGDLDKRQTAIQEMVKPLRETLDAFDSKVRDLEKARVGAYESLQQQCKTLIDSQGQLRHETNNLVRALGTPRVRGRWGEIQLRRVVEIAGMLENCDFQEQPSVSTEDGRLRPDLIIRLPGGKNIVVDAKAPLAAYLEAIETQDESVQREKLKDHARQVREHMIALSRKSYWDQFQPAPEFVVLFLPGESFFSAACDKDPGLIEQGVEQRVLLATPTTLIALLKAIAYGWRQENMAASSKEICDLGKELYKRIGDMTGHWAELGARLGRTVESYNKSVASLESRVLVSARKFHELDASGSVGEIDLLNPVEVTPRETVAGHAAVSESL